MSSNKLDENMFFRCGYFSTERQTMLAIHDEVSELPEGTYCTFILQNFRISGRDVNA
jgi:hypothetical protein